MWPLQPRPHARLPTALYHPRLFWPCIIPGTEVFNLLRLTLTLGVLTELLACPVWPQKSSPLRAHVVPSAYCTPGVTGKDSSWVPPSLGLTAEVSDRKAT